VTAGMQNIKTPGNTELIKRQGSIKQRKKKQKFHLSIEKISFFILFFWEIILFACLLIVNNIFSKNIGRGSYVE